MAGLGRKPQQVRLANGRFHVEELKAVCQHPGGLSIFRVHCALYCTVVVVGWNRKEGEKS